MDLTLSTLVERPELREAAWRIDDRWPEFLRNDLVGAGHVGRIATEFPEFVQVATDETGKVVARGQAVPFALRHEGRGEGRLPGRGWSQALLWAFDDRRRSVPPDTVSAIEIAVDAAHRGRGLSGRMLAAMRAGAAERGFPELVAPVRPNAKHREPHAPMAEYAFRVREDGLPHDPWLRVHVRAGGVIDSVTPASMVVVGTLAEWRSWTGLPFDTEGEVEVDGALNPVRCEPERDVAVYLEPNVWVRHTLD